MKDNTVKRVVMKAHAGLVAIAVASAVAGCTSPAPAASTEPPAAAPTSAAPGSGARPADLERDRATPAARPAPAPSIAPPPPTLRTYTLKMDRPIAVYTTTTLSTKTNQSGERFTATLAEPIVDGDWIVAKDGARVEGVIVDSDPGARVKGVASIAVTLESLTLADGRTVNLDASRYTRQAKTTKKKDAAKIGIATGIGAAVGAIAGGGKGAAIGAGVGGGAGTGAVLATRGDPAVIPAETRVKFTLKSPLTITEERRAPH
jgi:hypothetical protein